MDNYTERRGIRYLETILICLDIYMRGLLLLKIFISNQEIDLLRPLNVKTYADDIISLRIYCVQKWFESNNTYKPPFCRFENA
jgi:hypothetical protein